MKYIYLTLNWFFGFTFLFLGLLGMTETLPGGLCLVLMAFLLLPPVRRFCYSKLNLELSGKLRASFLFVLFIAFGIFSEQEQRQKEVAAAALTAQVEAAQIARARKENIEYFNANRDQIISSAKSALAENDFQSVIAQSSKYLVSGDSELAQLNDEATSTLREIEAAERAARGQAENEAKTKELLTALESIPESQYQNNLNHYRQLVDLNPDSTRYKEQMEFYSAKVQAQMDAEQVETERQLSRAQASFCGSQSTKTGQIYKVNGADVYLQNAPGSNGERLINERATSAIGTTQYLQIDNSTTVREECSEGDWSRVAVTEPDWLRDSHIGWVPSAALRGRVLDQSGQEVFTEADFLWDQTIDPYKEVIIAGVNKIYRENSQCSAIDPSSAYLSSNRGSSSDPVFFVTCGEGLSAFNVFFSKSEIESGSSMSAVGHIDRTVAIQMCEEYAKANATHPSTVEFSKFLDLAVTEHPNGNTTVFSTFTAKNRFNLELKYNIRCLSNAQGLFEGSINETQ